MTGFTYRFRAPIAARWGGYQPSGPDTPAGRPPDQGSSASPAPPVRVANQPSSVHALSGIGLFIPARLPPSPPPVPVERPWDPSLDIRREGNRLVIEADGPVRLDAPTIRAIASMMLGIASDLDHEAFVRNLGRE